jgi:hypothetical protein
MRKVGMKHIGFVAKYPAIESYPTGRVGKPLAHFEREELDARRDKL